MSHSTPKACSAVNNKRQGNIVFDQPDMMNLQYVIGSTLTQPTALQLLVAINAKS